MHNATSKESPPAKRGGFVFAERRGGERERQWRSAAQSPATMGAGLAEGQGRTPRPRTKLEIFVKSERACALFLNISVLELS